MSLADLSPFERNVITLASKMDQNWERVGFELDVEPDKCAAAFEAAKGKLNGDAASVLAVPPPAPATTPSGTKRTCADPECSIAFAPRSGAQKYCKDDACKRRRWARDKRQQSGSTTKRRATAAKAAAVVVRQAQPAPVSNGHTLADRYLAVLFARAVEDLTPEQARRELERLAGLGAS